MKTLNTVILLITLSFVSAAQAKRVPVAGDTIFCNSSKSPFVEVAGVGTILEMEDNMNAVVEFKYSVIAGGEIYDHPGHPNKIRSKNLKGCQYFNSTPSSDKKPVVCYGKLGYITDNFDNGMFKVYFTHYYDSRNGYKSRILDASAQHRIHSKYECEQ